MIDAITAGALVRRTVRVALDRQQVEWVEHKGLLESTFVVTASPLEWRRLLAVLKPLCD